MDTTNMKQNLARMATMLFVTVLTAWLWVAPAEVQAQTRDVITFTGGAPDPDNPDIYVIDAGDVAVDAETWLRSFTLTLSRPQGASANHEATIELRDLIAMGDGFVKVTFAPGETQKTITINTPTYTETCSGNLPAVFGVYYTQYAESEYQLLIVKMNTPAMTEAEPCTFATPLEALQQSITDYSYPHIMKWGGYVLLRFQFTTDVKIQPDSRFVVQVSEADHTGLAYDADDMGLVTTRELELSPLNAGSICDQALVLYRPSDDELLKIHKGEYAYDNTLHDDKGITYPTLEAGPFEVAYPAEDAIKYLFYSRTDLEQAQPFNVEANVYAFRPHFSNVSINKASFKSGETMVITATMDNWQMVKRAWQLKFLESFGVSLDRNSSIEPRRVSFNEATGVVTYYVTAPTVSETRTVDVDFGPMVQTIVTIHNDEYNYDYEREMLLVMTGAEGYFSVTVEPDAAPAVPATAIDFAGMPADGSSIIVETSQYGDFIWREIPLSIKPEPANATDIQNVTYEVINRGGSEAYVYTSEGEQPEFILGQEPGIVTVTATLESGVSTQRTYYLWVSPPQGVHHTNTFIAGTTFTQFQFEIMNDMGEVKDDIVTVNYTHANGATRTETYTFSELKRHKTDGDNYCYDVPFNFTEEFPEPTLDQIGEPLVTAQVVMQMPIGNNQYIDVEATATMVPDLKKPSFDDYSQAEVFYNETHPATISADVMHLPRKGFTVGYYLSGIMSTQQTYSNLSGEPLPDWLTLEEDGDYYYTAHISPQLDLTETFTTSFLYTMAQRSYDPNESMEYHCTRWCRFRYASAEDNLVYRVNGEIETGDRTFDNRQGVETFINKVRTAMDTDGILWAENKSFDVALVSSMYPDDIYNEVFDLISQTGVIFNVRDERFEGAEVTLKCDDEVIQTRTNYNGYFRFIPPADGRTYTVEIYFPAYNKRYTNTFVSGKFSNIYVINSNLRGVPTEYSSQSGNMEPKECELLFADGRRECVIPYWFNPDNPGGAWPGSTHNPYKIKGFIYAEDPTNFYLRDVPRYGNQTKVRITFKEKLIPLSFNPPKTLDNYFLSDFERRIREGLQYYWSNCIEWSELTSGNTHVTVINSEGQPITNATLHYACVDNTLAIQGNAETTGYDSSLGGYQISTDPAQYAQLIEVVADGYQPMLTTMYLWNYDYTSWQNRCKVRRHTIVLQQDDDQLNSLALETMKRSGNLVNNEMNAEINADNLLLMNQGETLNYSQTADYADVTKYMKDGKFGKTGWSGKKYAHLTGCLPYQQNTPNLTLTTGDGSLQLQPVETSLITTQDFTTFSQNYCLFDFDLTDQIAADATMQPVLMDGTQTLATLPSLHNHTIDLMALNDANNIKLDFDGIDLTNVDNDARSNGVNMKDMDKAFDKFNFQIPDVLPFTVNIERNGDYFTVRAVCEVNFLPSGLVMDALDKLNNLQYFDEQFQACMDAVNTAKSADDDFFDDIPRWPSAFCGIKGFLSGIGYVNSETGKLDINFLDGGLTFEASAKAQANVSFGLGGFGMSIDAKIAMTMALINRAAAMGDVAALPKIDFVIDNQCRLKVCAWAYGGIDIWIAKAKAGVRGGASIDVRQRTIYGTGTGVNQTGAMTTLRAKMEAFAEVRFLFWKAKKSWTILNAKKEYLTPNNASNPFHPDNPEPIFSISRQNVTKGYRKLKRRAIADLGTPIINNVNGMAQPTYMLGGNSLLFNNLKDAGEYNDDRLQIYSGGSKTDLVDTGIEAPMYDFAVAHNNNGLELVAFEQVKERLDDDALEAMADNDQVKTVTEKSEIHVAMREQGGDWTTERVGSYWGSIACVTPAVAVQDDGKAVVIWQQGVAKFNDQGDRYIDGSLMLSRYDGSYWGQPIEIKRLNRRSVPADYQVSMKDDDILVMMTLQQDVNNSMKQASVVYVTVSADDKVREHYTQVEGSKPQMVSVNGANLVGFLKVNENGRDIELSTVDMKGELTGKLTGDLGMKSRMVNDFRLIVDDEGDDLADVALLWSQSDQETTDNGDGTQTVNIKNRIYVSKLCSNNKELYFSTPIEIATIPDDVSLASMDGYLDGLNMKVAYCVTNEQDGAAVMETPVVFTNAIDHRMTFNPYEMTDEKQVPVTITVANNGYDPIESIDVMMGGETYTHYVSLMPQETTDLTVNYPVTDNFDGTIDYQVAAEFATANSNSLKIRRQAAARPHRVEQSGTQADVRQVDMALKVLSKRTVGEVTTVVAEVNNASLLPLADGMSVKVGLYDTPLATEKVAGTTEVTVTAADLYDASAEQKNKVKIVTLTATQPDVDQVLYLRTTPMQGNEMLTDVRPSNNVLPVIVKGRYLLGDVNGDGVVDTQDAIKVVQYYLQKNPDNFILKAADVTKSGAIDTQDAIQIIRMYLKK